MTSFFGYLSRCQKSESRLIPIESDNTIRFHGTPKKDEESLNETPFATPEGSANDENDEKENCGFFENEWKIRIPKRKVIFGNQSCSSSCNRSESSYKTAISSPSVLLSIRGSLSKSLRTSTKKLYSKKKRKPSQKRDCKDNGSKNLFLTPPRRGRSSKNNKRENNQEEHTIYTPEALQSRATISEIRNRLNIAPQTNVCNSIASSCHEKYFTPVSSQDAQMNYFFYSKRPQASPRLTAGDTLTAVGALVAETTTTRNDFTRALAPQTATTQNNPLPFPSKTNAYEPILPPRSWLSNTDTSELSELKVNPNLITRNSNLAKGRSSMCMSSPSTGFSYPNSYSEDTLEKSVSSISWMQYNSMSEQRDDNYFNRMEVHHDSLLRQVGEHGENEISFSSRENICVVQSPYRRYDFDPILNYSTAEGHDCFVAEFNDGESNVSAITSHTFDCILDTATNENRFPDLPVLNNIDSAITASETGLDGALRRRKFRNQCRGKERLLLGMISHIHDHPNLLHWHINETTRQTGMIAGYSEEHKGRLLSNLKTILSDMGMEPLERGYESHNNIDSESDLITAFRFVIRAVQYAAVEESFITEDKFMHNQTQSAKGKRAIRNNQSAMPSLPPLPSTDPQNTSIESPLMTQKKDRNYGFDPYGIPRSEMCTSGIMRNGASSEFSSPSTSTTPNASNVSMGNSVATTDSLWSPINKEQFLLQKIINEIGLMEESCSKILHIEDFSPEDSIKATEQIKRSYLRLMSNNYQDIQSLLTSFMFTPDQTSQHTQKCNTNSNLNIFPLNESRTGDEVDQGRISKKLYQDEENKSELQELLLNEGDEQERSFWVSLPNEEVKQITSQVEGNFLENIHSSDGNPKQILLDSEYIDKLELPPFQNFGKEGACNKIENNKSNMECCFAIARESNYDDAAYTIKKSTPQEETDSIAIEGASSSISKNDSLYIFKSQQMTLCDNEEVHNTTKTLSITEDEECCFASVRAVNDEIILEEVARDKSNIIQHKTKTRESANSTEEICHNEELRSTNKTLSLTEDEECCFASARAVNDEIISEKIARDEQSIIQHKTEALKRANSMEDLEYASSSSVDKSDTEHDLSIRKIFLRCVESRQDGNITSITNREHSLGNLTGIVTATINEHTEERISNQELVQADLESRPPVFALHTKCTSMAINSVHSCNIIPESSGTVELKSTSEDYNENNSNSKETRELKGLPLKAPATSKNWCNLSKKDYLVKENEQQFKNYMDVLNELKSRLEKESQHKKTEEFQTLSKFHETNKCIANQIYEETNNLSTSIIEHDIAKPVLIAPRFESVLE